MASKQIAVLWSGGMDSTGLIYKALKEGHRVHAYYTEIENNCEKVKWELAAIYRLTNLFKEEFPQSFHYGLTPNSISISTLPHNLAFTQPPAWIFSSWYITASREFDELWIGYVMNDDAISYLEDIRKLYKSIIPFLNVSSNLPDLKFPFMKVKKQEIWVALPEKYREVCVWCEHPNEDGSACERCHSCLRHKAELPPYCDIKKKSPGSASEAVQVSSFLKHIKLAKPSNEKSPEEFIDEFSEDPQHSFISLTATQLKKRRKAFIARRKKKKIGNSFFSSEIFG